MELILIKEDEFKEIYLIVLNVIRLENMKYLYSFQYGDDNEICNLYYVDMLRKKKISKELRENKSKKINKMILGNIYNLIDDIKYEISFYL